MGYADIDNLYKNQEILLFKEAWAMEKIHGTSAHIRWQADVIDGAVIMTPDVDGTVTFFSGGEKHENFIQLFDQEKLKAAFKQMMQPVVTVYGEAYGGKCQGMSHTYGKQLKFIVFDVKIGRLWLATDDAEKIATALGLEFVYYRKIPMDLAAIDAERDAPSEQAFRNGCAVREDKSTHKPREGIVLRPLIAVIKNNGSRIVAKHKAETFRETRTVRKVDTAKQKILEAADAIAAEWVTPMRMAHVIDKIKSDRQRDILTMEDTRAVMLEMIADIIKEGSDEIVMSKEARKAISSRAAVLFKQLITRRLYETNEDSKVC